MKTYERNDASADLIKFISEFAAIPLNKISHQSSFERDLKIYGDDLAELIDAYAKRFNVDIARFDGQKYISPEGIDILGALIALFNNNQKKTIANLTVKNLVDGICAGRLDEIVINDSLAE